MSKTVAVLGAGMVGISCALELQTLGNQVTLIDRGAPGRETSYGNAGVLTRSSLLPLNNTGLWRNLPKMLGNRQTSMRYRLDYMMRNPTWGMRFLGNALPRRVRETCRALDSLIALSLPVHDAWITDAGYQAHLRKTGWLHAFRSLASHAHGEANRHLLAGFGLTLTDLSPKDLADLEPGLSPIFKKAVLIEDTWSVDDPGGLVEAYATLFRQRGGTILQAEVKTPLESETGVDIALADGRHLAADRAVVAMGPWSRPLLERLGYRVPMGYERGYHMHFAPMGASTLTRPLYDVDGGCVLAPMVRGIRVTTGVELADLEAPANHAQITLAEAAARQALPLGERVDAAPWKGARPSFPDSRPIIDRAPGRQRIWLAFGHQHIGLNTGPGTAKLLTALMEGMPPPIDPGPFRASRFLS